MPLETVDCIVIGAGVVGLAAARALAQAGREVIILEAADLIGSETSSRNSEVIHAGIYYPQGSLKAQLCVAGKHALYDYCTSHGVEHRRCGKLIVATDGNQLDTLRSIEQKAINNGVTDLLWQDVGQVAELEPAVRCVAALLSPSTGIIDSHGLMLAYLGDAEDAGAMLALNSPVEGGEITPEGIVLEVGGAEPMSLLARCVVNSAGLYAGKLAHSLRGLPAETIPPHYYAKGNYYSLSGRSPFSRLIYPVPEQAGLGVHVSVDLGGQARFGPDVEWIDTINYDVDPRRADVFYAAVRKYWPDLPDGALTPGYAGIRPKLQAPGEPAADFVIQGPEVHGVPNLVNLYGIESPGLTASLAIAERVCMLVD
ncbi:MAG: NAD(P)/FAD-dependent oxidoreductase [Gammaproteobacteria bacterium]